MRTKNSGQCRFCSVIGFNLQIDLKVVLVLDNVLESGNLTETFQLNYIKINLQISSKKPEKRAR